MSSGGSRFIASSGKLEAGSRARQGRRDASGWDPVWTREEGCASERVDEGRWMAIGLAKGEARC